MIESILSVATLASLALEGLKALVRIIKKDMSFDFSEQFYYITLPVMQLLVQPVLVWLEVIPVDAMELSFKLVFIVFVESVMSVVLYNTGIKPFKAYREEQALAKVEAEG